MVTGRGSTDYDRAWSDQEDYGCDRARVATRSRLIEAMADGDRRGHDHGEHTCRRSETNGGSRRDPGMNGLLEITKKMSIQPASVKSVR